MEEKRQGGNPNARNMGFIDDYSNDSLRGTSSIQRKNGTVVYANPIEDETKPKRRVTKNSRKRYRKNNSAYIVIGLVFALVLTLSIILIVKNPAKKNSVIPETTIENTAEVSDSAFSESSSATTEEETVKKSVTVNNTEIHTGDLILVNYQHEYVFPENDILVSMYNTSKYFSVNYKETYIQECALDSFKNLMKDMYENTDCDNVLVVSAFRSVEKQQEIYNDRLEQYGSEYAAAYVADPGYSEHHTGLAMDLEIYADDGLVYDIDTYPQCCDWFNTNYDKYGYILRYPADKAGITAINFEGWHYRYVGLPHSLIMTSQNLCHEEYIDYIKNYSYKNPLCYNKNTYSITENSGDNENLYIIYYVKAEDGDTTEIPVDTSRNYSISGNNIDGFIVTVMPAE